jgi:hypothetical protein
VAAADVFLGMVNAADAVLGMVNVDLLLLLLLLAGLGRCPNSSGNPTVISISSSTTLRRNNQGGENAGKRASQSPHTFKHSCRGKQALAQSVAPELPLGVKHQDATRFSILTGSAAASK